MRRRPTGSTRGLPTPACGRRRTGERVRAPPPKPPAQPPPPSLLPQPPRARASSPRPSPFAYVAGGARTHPGVATQRWQRMARNAAAPPTALCASKPPTLRLSPPPPAPLLFLCQRNAVCSLARTIEKVATTLPLKREVHAQVRQRVLSPCLLCWIRLPAPPSRCATSSRADQTGRHGDGGVRQPCGRQPCGRPQERPPTPRRDKEGRTRPGGRACPRHVTCRVAHGGRGDTSAAGGRGGRGWRRQRDADDAPLFPTSGAALRTAAMGSPRRRAASFRSRGGTVFSGRLAAAWGHEVSTY